MLNRVLLMVTSITMFTIIGCSGLSTAIPEGQPELKISTNTTWEVIGSAEGSSSGVMVLGIIPIGMENKAGFIAGRTNYFRAYDPIAHNRVMRAAIYNAIESVPDADALIAPRYEAKTRNFLLFQTQSITVKGKAIRYGSE